MTRKGRKGDLLLIHRVRKFIPTLEFATRYIVFMVKKGEARAHSMKKSFSLTQKKHEFTFYLKYTKCLMKFLYSEKTFLIGTLCSHGRKNTPYIERYNQFSDRTWLIGSSSEYHSTRMGKTSCYECLFIAHGWIGSSVSVGKTSLFSK